MNPMTPLQLFYLIGSLLILGIAILVYPTLKDRSNKERSKRKRK